MSQTLFVKFENHKPAAAAAAAEGAAVVVAAVYSAAAFVPLMATLR
jgi:hypothetical protein